MSLWRVNSKPNMSEMWRDEKDWERQSQGKSDLIPWSVLYCVSSQELTMPLAHGGKQTYRIFDLSLAADESILLIQSLHFTWNRTVNRRVNIINIMKQKKVMNEFLC